MDEIMLVMTDQKRSCGAISCNVDRLLLNNLIDSYEKKVCYLPEK